MVVKRLKSAKIFYLHVPNKFFHKIKIKKFGFWKTKEWNGDKSNDRKRILKLFFVHIKQGTNLWIKYLQSIHFALYNFAFIIVM